MLREAFGIEPGGVDLPTFPPFALFDPALGLTSIIPDMDPTKPALADPRKLHDAIARFGVDQLFGSPALMGVLARHGAPLPTLRRVTSAGAPVPADVVAKMRELLPDDAQFWTPYGATECLPVAVIEGRELQATRAATEAGAGTCVGRAGGAERGAHHPHQRRRRSRQWSDELRAARRRGRRDHRRRPHRNRQLLQPRGADAAGEDPRARWRRWQRSASSIAWAMSATSMDEGRLWFCGRKSHRVETRGRPALHRTGRAGVQHPSRRAAHRAGGRWARRARRRRCCASS